MAKWLWKFVWKIRKFCDTPSFRRESSKTFSNGAFYLSNFISFQILGFHQNPKMSPSSQCAPLPTLTSSIQASLTICVHSTCHLAPRYLKDIMRQENVRTRLPSPPPKNLLPYPLKGRCTEQGHRSSPVIPFYPSGFSNKCALQAFNLWPLHLRTTVM